METRRSHESKLTTYRGGCHCGRVRFEAQLDLSKGTGRCNCSICRKDGAWGTSVKPAAFTLLCGEESLRDYQFNSRSVHHVFCAHCGVRAFAHGNIPEIGGEFYSINLNCLDEDIDPASVPLSYYDGRNDDWTPRPAPVHRTPSGTAS